MQAFYATQFVLPLPAGHRFPMAKYQLLRDRLAAELPGLELMQAMPATDGELALIHSPAYISAICDGSVDAKLMREIGFPWSEAMAERARRSVGATISACRAALKEGVAANIAGGTHHAYADKGGGFCVFNDAAVASRLMQAEWARSHARPLKVAIVDLDVHQGNGTARIFQGDASVLELAQRFEPGLVIYLAGADPHEGDRLGRLKLTWDGLEARDRRVFDWAWERRIPLAFAMAGGYGTRIEDTVQAQVNTFKVAAEYARRWQNRAR
jgi:acetoin utilization deacetylase AcuC-like enzyme